MPLLPLSAASTQYRRLGLLVVAIAIVVRAVAWTELRNSALLHLERWPESQMHYVDTWARAVTGGDLLLRSQIEPRDAGFLCPQRTATEAVESRCADPADAAALRRWTRTATYWEAPLYPYFVAAVYAMVGPDPRAVLVLQTLLGVVSCWLAFAIAAQLFGDAAALAAGLLAALLGTGVYYETLLVPGACTGLAALATLYALLRAIESRRPFAAAFTAGVAGAAAALLSTVTCVAVAASFAAALGVRVCRDARPDRSTAARFLAGLVCGVALMSAPLVARNLAVGAPPLAIAARTRVDFVMGNALGATAVARVKPNALTTAIFAQRESAIVARRNSASAGDASDADVSAGDASAGDARDVDVSAGDASDAGASDAGVSAAAERPIDTYALVADTIASHATLAGWCGLVAVKFAAFWRWYEIASDANYYYFLEHLPVTSRFLVGWSLLAGFVALGLLSTTARGPAAVLLPVWIVATALACALLLNLSLLRFAAVLVATPLAGRGVAMLIALDRERRYTLALLAAIFVVAVDYATLARWQVPFGATRPQYYDVTNYLAVAVAEEEQDVGHTQRALATVRKQLRAEPLALRNVVPGGELALDPWIAANASSFEAIYASQARYAALLGYDADAREAARCAARLHSVVEQWQSWPSR